MSTECKFGEPPFSVEQLVMPYDVQDGEKATPTEQLANAAFMTDALNNVLSNTRPPSDKVIERNEESRSLPWLGDVVRSLIRNDVLTVEPTGLDIAGRSFDRENHSLAIAGLLRSIAPPNNRMSMVTVHHEPLVDVIRPVTPDQPKFLRTSAARLIAGRAVFEGDTPGKQFTLIPTQGLEKTQKAQSGLLNLLQHSRWGNVGIGYDGHIAFKTSPELEFVTMPVRDGARVKDKGRDVVLKSLVGQSALTVLHAQALAGVFSRNPNHNHLALVSGGSWHSFLNIFALLRATEMLKHHQFHVVSPVLRYEMAEEQFAHLMARQFLHHTERFIEAATSFADFDDFDPYEYVGRNYGQAEAMLDDQNICKIISFALSKLGIKDADVADVGCGPNPYPAMLLAPFARSIDLLEFSPPNRKYMKEFLAGRLPEDKMRIWPKFGAHMVEGGGTAYQDVMQRLQHMASEGHVKVRFGNIFELPKKKWKIVSQYFVDDSISLYRSDHREAVASVCEATEDEGLVIAGNMLNSKNHTGYQAGEGKVFPNISQNALELKQAYTDNQMYSLVIETSGTEKARQGYDGMAVVLAAHRGSAMQRKLQDLKPQLAALGFKVV